jgi:hypothetical protein
MVEGEPPSQHRIRHCHRIDAVFAAADELAQLSDSGV